MIGVYAHHHGAGHLVRATVLARHAPEPVTLLTSAEVADPSPFHEVVRLPLDSPDRLLAPVPGLAHHAPLGDPGLRSRMATIAAWVDRAAPAGVVVDVSSEVAVMLRLLGVRVVVVRQHGRRDDGPHLQAARAACRLIAPWPHWLDVGHEDRWSTSTTWTGGFSRHEGRADGPPGPGHGVVLLGGRGGGGAIATVARRLRRQDPDRAIVVLGPAGGPLPPDVEHVPWSEDPWAAMRAAEVVVTTASQNCVMDAATTGRPLVVVADDRPFDEQVEKARRLADADAARHVPDPGSADWPGVLDAAVGEPPTRTADLVAGGGAPRYAEAVRAACGLHSGRARRPTAAVPTVGVSVCTIVRGRLDHLARQHEALRATAPDAEHVVAWMGGPDPAAAAPGARIVEVAGDGPLPLAAARNVALSRAQGDVLVLLDVDCVPDPGAVDALRRGAHATDGLLIPRVLYVPDPGDGAEASEHPARRVPAGDLRTLVPADDWSLAWTVALAGRADVWRAVGSFDEAFVGYGGEDTDLAWRCRAAGLPLHWAARATVRHLPHPPASRSASDAPDVVANAIRFHRRWGEWPMRPWLRDFADRGWIGPDLDHVLHGPPGPVERVPGGR